MCNHWQFQCTGLTCSYEHDQVQKLKDYIRYVQAQLDMLDDKILSQRQTLQDIRQAANQDPRLADIPTEVEAKIASLKKDRAKEHGNLVRARGDLLDMELWLNDLGFIQGSLLNLPSEGPTYIKWLGYAHSGKFLARVRWPDGLEAWADPYALAFQHKVVSPHD